MREAILKIIDDHPTRLAGIALLLAIGCLLSTAAISLWPGTWFDVTRGDFSDPDYLACERRLDSLPASKEGAGAADRATTQLSILDVWPKNTFIGRSICVTLNNVISPEDEKEKNLSKKPVALKFYLNALEFVDFKTFAMPQSKPQTVLVRLSQTSRSTDELAKAWTSILKHGTGINDENDRLGEKSVLVGVSRENVSIPEARAPNAIKLIVYHPVPVLLGALAFLAAVVWFVSLARTTTIFRDNVRTMQTLKSEMETPAAGVDTATLTAEFGKLGSLHGSELWRPIGSYSLGRTQMAFWLFVVVAGFVFIWLTTGIYGNIINTNILTLMGLSAATGLSAAMIKQDVQERSTTKGFLKDLIEDSHGPSLTRIQAVVWTIILGSIFVWGVFWNFAFAEFDSNLLLLMGLVGSMYVGFKAAEPMK